MKRLLLSLFFLSLFAAGVPAVFGQACATPQPTYTPTPGYRATVQAVSPGNLFAYYPLDETAGTTARDDSGNSSNATYNGVTLNAVTFLTGDPAVSSDGVNDSIDAYSATFISNFNRLEGTFMIWVKVNSSFWTDGVIHNLINVLVDGSNFTRIRKQASNVLRFSYVAGGTSETIDLVTTNTNWLVLIWTWSKSADTVRAYQSGASVGTSSTLGTFAGAISSSQAVFGATNNLGGNSLPGNIAQVAFWKVALNATQAAILATVPPIMTIPPTATVCPTYTYTPSLTPSNTPSWTWTPSLTPSNTPTPTNTPAIYHFWTQPAPVGTLAPGATGTATPAPGLDVVFVSQIDAGDVGISFFLATIFFSLLIMWLFMLFVRRGAGKPPKKD